MKENLSIIFLGDRKGGERISSLLEKDYFTSVDLRNLKKIPLSVSKNFSCDGIFIDFDSLNYSKKIPLIRDIRGKYSDTPLIAISKDFKQTADIDNEEIINSYTAGVDYVHVSKETEYNYHILAERFKNLIGQYASPANHNKNSGLKSIINIGDFSIDSECRTIKYRNVPATLTKKEFDIVFLLAQNPEIVKARSFILDNIQEENKPVYDRTIDAHIKNIRRECKKAGFPEIIKTIRGLGFSFSPPSQDKTPARINDSRSRVSAHSSLQPS